MSVHEWQQTFMPFLALIGFALLVLAVAVANLGSDCPFDCRDCQNIMQAERKRQDDAQRQYRRNLGQRTSERDDEER